MRVQIIFGGCFQFEMLYKLHVTWTILSCPDLLQRWKNYLIFNLKKNDEESYSFYIYIYIFV